MNFLTNTYSNYAPTNIGDTVEEEAMLAKTQAENYTKAQSSIRDNQEKLLEIEAFPNHQQGVDDFNRYYTENVNELSEQGNFEDNVNFADTLMKEGSEKYHIKDIQRDAKAWQEFTKGIDESDNDAKTRNYLRQDALKRNPGYVTNPQTGEREFQSFNPNAAPLRNKEDVHKEVVSQLESYRADGTIVNEYDDNGRPIGIKLTRPIPGKISYEEGKVVSEEDIYKATLEMINSNNKLDESVNLESEMNVRGYYYNKGGFDIADSLNFASKAIRLNPDSNEYKKELSAYKDIIEKELQARQVLAQQEGQPFNQEEELVDITTNLERERLRTDYGRRAAEHLGYRDLKLKNVSDELFNAKKDGDGNDAGALSNVTIYGAPIQTTESFNPSSVVKQRRAELVPQLTASTQELRELKKAKRDNPDSVTDGQITSKEQEIAAMQRDLNSVNEAAEIYGKNMYNRMGINKNKSFKEYRDDTYDLYTSYVEGSNNENLSRNAMNNQKVYTNQNRRKAAERVYAQLDPSYEEGTPLSRQQWDIALNHEMDTLANGEDSSFNFRETYIEDFSNSLKSFKKTNPDESWRQNIEYLTIDETDVTTGKKSPSLVKYNQAKSAMSKLVGSNLENFSSIYNIPLDDHIEQYRQKGIKLDMTKAEVKPAQELVNGKMTMGLIVPTSDADSDDDYEIEKGNIEIPFYLDSGNNVGETMKDLLSNSIRSFDLDLTKNIDNLSPSEEEALSSITKVKNSLDGTSQQFEKLNLTGLEAGEKRSFGLGDTNYDFVAYPNYGSVYGENNLLIQKQGTHVEDKNGMVHSNSTGVLGWKNVEYDENNKPIPGTGNYDKRKGKPIILPDGSRAKPKYYRINTSNNNSLNNPYRIETDDETKERSVNFNDWFEPYEESNPYNILNRITTEKALERGTFDKQGISPIFKGAGDYIKQHRNSTNVNNLIQKKRHYMDKGYTPLTDLIPAENISAVTDDSGTGVNIPFMDLNEEGVTKVKSLFNLLRSNSSDVMITGGARDGSNIVADGADNSKHKDFIALDLLKTDASKLILDNWNNEASRKVLKEKFGIVNVLSNYDSHIHIEFDSNLRNNFEH